MRLSETQRERIQKYLVDVEQRVVSNAAGDRGAILRMLKDHIHRELLQLRHRDILDEDIDAILQGCDRLAEQALKGGTAALVYPAEDVSKEDRVWLGVCAEIAKQWDMPSRWIRVGLVLLGLFPPITPFLLIAYLAGYFYFYFYQTEKTDRIDYFAVARFTGLVFAEVFALYLISIALLEFIARVTFTLFGKAPVLAERWTWLEHEGASWFFWALIYLLPGAVIATLPVPSGWRETLRKVVYAGVAMYAVLVCFGIASYLVGTLLYLAEQQVSTMDLMEIIQNIPQ